MVARRATSDETDFGPRCNYLRIDYLPLMTPKLSLALKRLAVGVSAHGSDPTGNSPLRTAAINGAALNQNVVKDRRNVIGLVI
jgi:hypothetical protein